MRLQNYIEKGLIFAGLRPADKLSLLRMLATQVKEQKAEIDQEDLLQRLLKREEQVSTGIGHSVAVPHATVERLPGPVCVLAQIPGGVDFKALDATPVHFVFLLLSPPAGIRDHVKLLARIARLVEREDFIVSLARAKDVEEIYSLIVSEDNRHV